MSKKYEQYLNTFEIHRKIELDKGIDFVIISGEDSEENNAIIIKTTNSESYQEYRKIIRESLVERHKRIKDNKINSTLTLTFTESILSSVWGLCYTQQITLNTIIEAFIRFEKFDEYSEKMNDWFRKVLKYC